MPAYQSTREVLRHELRSLAAGATRPEMLMPRRMGHLSAVNLPRSAVMRGDRTEGDLGKARRLISAARYARVRAVSMRCGREVVVRDP
jgi:hypothetical protein